MGLIAAALGAAAGSLADQYKEFFYCEALDKNVLMKKGQKHSGKMSSNRGSDNIITNGSAIAVADGQCMIIVDQGEVVEVCAQPGEFVYDTSTEPSVFYGGLGKGILDTFKNIGKRITLGGDTGHDQRIYYFNTKELIDNKFGTANPIMFRVVDNKIGLDLDTSIRCNGVYSYKITDPLLFYTNVCGNVTDEYRREQIDGQLKTEFVSALQPAMALSIEPDLESVDFRGYEELLPQVWTNLISNSIKFTPAGGTIVFRLHAADGGVVFSITDNGIGMNEEEQAHAFDKFYQAENNHSVAGNGLGLPLVKQIVDMHGGTVKIKSAPDEGSTFTIFLPN